MPKVTLASVDSGNGTVNAFIVSGRGNSYRNHTMSACRVETHAAKLDLDGFAKESNAVTWKGNNYLFGDDALHSRQRVEREMGRNRYGGEFHRSLVATALANLGVKNGTVELTLFCPPQVYQTSKQEIIDDFMNEKVTIRLAGDDKPRRWEYSSVKVYPEGFGAALCFIVDSRGKLYDNDFLDGSTAVIDIGARTTDIIVLVDGEVDLEDWEHATHDKVSVHNIIRKPILAELKRNNKGLGNVEYEHIDMAVKNFFDGDGRCAFRYGSEMIDISEHFEERRIKLAEEIQSIIETDLDGLDGFSNLILVGGGSLAVEPYLSAWYSDWYADPSKNDETKHIHPIDFNALGGLLLAMYQRNQAKSVTK